MYSKNLSWTSSHKEFIEEKVSEWVSTKYWKSCKHLTDWKFDVNICWFNQKIDIEVKFGFEDDPDLDFSIKTVIRGSNDYTFKKLKEYWNETKQELEDEFKENYSCCFKE